jgi:bifunctional DNase/RNase
VTGRSLRRSTARCLCGVLVVGAVAVTAACKRRGHETAPGPVASATPTLPTAPPAPVASPGSAQPTSFTTPSEAAYADGGAPRGYDRVAVWDLVPSGDGAAVLLLDSTHTTVLPIFVADADALTIRLELDGKHRERPLTHDLLSSILKGLGARPVKVQIDDLRDDTYFGSLFLRQGDRVIALDARPSDAITIALESGAPLYVSKAVMLGSGVPREALEKARKIRPPSPARTPISL